MVELQVVVNLVALPMKCVCVLVHITLRAVQLNAQAGTLHCARAATWM